MAHGYKFYQIYYSNEDDIMGQQEFKKEILRRIEGMSGEYIDIVSGNVHRAVGGYPSTNHRMPTCCAVMRELMRGDDMVVSEPPSGKGATLCIRYFKKNH